MTFDEWFEENHSIFNLYEKSDLRELWQTAQAAEKERAKELVHELKNVLNFVDHWEPSFIIDDPDWPATQERAITAITKYQGEANE